MAAETQLRMQLNWRGKLAKVGLEVATLASALRMRRLSEVIAKASVREFMSGKAFDASPTR